MDVDHSRDGSGKRSMDKRRFISKTEVTNRSLQTLLPQFLQQMQKLEQIRPDLLIAGWKELVGDRVSMMTEAVSFIEGVLSVKVSNSSLLSLLVQNEKTRLLKELRGKYPGVAIRNIRFYVG